ncbi:hypothetical protein [Mycoplasmopsis gallinarum]|uniref:Lipoprotein n=1 Tax=Mycoplasmopsis gallinarum TaxID=29557 RepID=A0A168RMZ3_9BACT|nr:hypothetical protein [Mycoplasmopsis gallinarum]OAB49131.1 hypothetical protein MGALLINA_01790 [Mycoplasmopsis gallinarum]
MKKKILSFLITSSLFPIMVSTQCQNETKNIQKEEVIINKESNSYGFGIQPSYLENIFKSNQSFTDKIKFLNKTLTTPLSETLFNNEEYFLDMKNSIFQDWNTPAKDREAKLILINQNGTKSIIINIENLGKNNETNPTIHEYSPLFDQWYWNGELYIQGIATSKDFAVVHQLDPLTIAKELKQRTTFSEQIKFLQSLFNIQFKNNDLYDYHISDSTHAHSKELHFVFGRSLKTDNNDPNKIHWISNVIKGLEANEIYAGDHDGDWQSVNEFNLGPLHFNLTLKEKGKSLISDDFLELLQREAGKYDGEEKTIHLLNVLNQYITIEGIENYNPTEFKIIFDLDSSHSHGSGNAHMYIQYLDLSSNDPQLKGFSFPINGWGQKFKAGGITFSKSAGIYNETKTHSFQSLEQIQIEKALFTTPYELIKELPKFDNFNDQLTKLQEYVNVEFGTNWRDFDYEIDLNQSLYNIPYANDIYDAWLDLESSSYDDEKSILILNFKRQNRYTGNIQENSVQIKGFKNLQTNKPRYYQSFFDNKLQLNGILDSYNKMDIETFLAQMNFKGTFEKQIAYLEEIFGSSDNFVNELDKENYDYRFDLQNVLVGSSPFNAFMDLKLEQIDKSTQNVLRVAKIKLVNFEVDGDVSNRLFDNSKYLTIDSYVYPNFDDGYVASEVLAKLRETNKSKLSLMEVRDILYPLNIVLTSKAILGSANYADLGVVVLTINTKNKLTEERETNKIYINNFGKYINVAGAIINQRPDELESNGYRILNSVTEIQNQLNAIDEDSEILDKNKAKVTKLFELLKANSFVGIKNLETQEVYGSELNWDNYEIILENINYLAQKVSWLGSPSGPHGLEIWLKTTNKTNAQDTKNYHFLLSFGNQ